MTRQELRPNFPAIYLASLGGQSFVHEHPTSCGDGGAHLINEALSVGVQGWAIVRMTPDHGEEARKQFRAGQFVVHD